MRGAYGLASSTTPSAVPAVSKLVVPGRCTSAATMSRNTSAGSRKLTDSSVPAVDLIVCGSPAVVVGVRLAAHDDDGGGAA